MNPPSQHQLRFFNRYLPQTIVSSCMLASATEQFRYRGEKALYVAERIWIGLIVVVNLAAIAGGFYVAGSFWAGVQYWRDMYDPGKHGIGAALINEVLLSPAALMYTWRSRLAARH